MLNNYRSYALWAPEMAAYGGVQSYMWRLWEMLQTVYDRKTSLEVKGITLKDSTEAIGSWPNAIIRRPSGAFGNRLRFVMSALSQKGRTDLVIVGHLNQSPVAWIAKRFGLIRDYVVVLHGIEAWRRAGLLERLALGAAHNIVATTRFTATICAEVNDLPPDKFAVLPLCAEPQPVPPDPNFKLDGEWPILFVARLSKSERYKGLETLIEAVGALKREGLPLKLHVIGEGDDRRYFEIYACTHLSQSDGVTFHGHVDGARLQAAYKSAKAFVMPSAKEGFGIVFLEAMRYSVPCIGATNGGTPEVFADGLEGLLVPFRQVESLKEQIRKLFGDRHFAKQIGQAAYHRFNRDYTFHAFVERWLKFLQIAKE